MRSECRKQGRSVRDALVAVKGVTHKAKQEECMDYTTQMDAARKGIVTPEMKAAAEAPAAESASKAAFDARV